MEVEMKKLVVAVGFLVAPMSRCNGKGISDFPIFASRCLQNSVRRVVAEYFLVYQVRG
jgi:hypothetical protein